jgi:GT2 family glycosyltransferase
VPAPVLIVVPTLGRRLDFLEQTLHSISQQEPPADVVVVTPAGAAEARALAAAAGARTADDPGSLPAAINLGASLAGHEHEFVNWIGDDDLLEPGSLAATVGAMRRDRGIVVAYGACRYIDDEGRALWTSQAGRWAQRILPWGPDLIPQPGMLVRTDAWRAVGGVDESLRFAFDLDLLLKLRPLGRFADVGAVVSSFRWHPDSLTVSDRTASLDESEAVKRRYLSRGARRMSWTWEGPVRLATRAAAREVTRRAVKARAGV